MNTMPVIFVSHGAPTMALEPGGAGTALSALGGSLARPESILMVSAHWETSQPTLSLAARPATIHDFGGFPEALYRMTYPAPGAPALALRAQSLLRQEGIPAELDPDRGLDHGAWVPLRFLFPAADVPVMQLSIQSHLSPLHHYRVGEALSTLSKEGVLVIASGSLTHNLGEVWMNARNGTAAAWAREFQDWVRSAIEGGETAALLDYRRLAPNARRAHPTDEHLLPLFVALGAGGNATTRRRLTDEITYGTLAMDAYVFETPAVEIRGAPRLAAH
jgi:4,5-DOPA dioxygenase extradiol